MAAFFMPRNEIFNRYAKKAERGEIGRRRHGFMAPAAGEVSVHNSKGFPVKIRPCLIEFPLCKHLVFQEKAPIFDAKSDKPVYMQPNIAFRFPQGFGCIVEHLHSRQQAIFAVVFSVDKEVFYLQLFVETA